jgi:mitochondrial enoyl-[acyl-carrier protein] reductase / trans-2-enoyl-CoA reductase
MGVRTVNIVRDRPTFADLAGELQGLGADLVATPDSVRERCKASGMPPPKLGLNCVGGEVATTMAKMLAPGGTLVTYGGMSLKPVTVPTPVLIFKDVRVRGFWISGGEASAEPQSKAALLDRVVALVQQGVLRAEATQAPLDEWQDVMRHVLEGSRQKYLLTP